VLTLAFWNVAGNVAPVTVAAFAHESDADILILAENKTPVQDLVLALNAGVKRYYFPDAVRPGRLTIFTRFLPDPEILICDATDISIRHFRPPIGEPILVVAAHLPSKLHLKTEDQIFVATSVGDDIRRAEREVGHQRTVVIGDLNMNPFEVGMVASEGLHALMDKDTVSRQSRRVRGKDRAFFYNPMWSFFGDQGSSPPGTYYRPSGAAVSYFWHIFDQVLIRPSLLRSLEKDGIRIVTEVSGASLLNKNGRPNASSYSDHLPLVCRLSLIEELVHA
jgi:hypothetical protein